MTSKKKLAVMQPYFFPYIGYFQLINRVDEFLLFEDVQYIRKGWVNRNRVLKNEGSDDTQFISIPINRGSRSDSISTKVVAAPTKWRNSVFGALASYRRAPFYQSTIDFVMDTLQHDSSQLSEILAHTLIETCSYLDISTPVTRQSQLSEQVTPATHAGEWGLNFALLRGARAYLNPAGGRHLFDVNEFARADVRLGFFDPSIENYSQGTVHFVEKLSIVDCLMWCGVDHVRSMVSEGTEHWE